MRGQVWGQVRVAGEVKGWIAENVRVMEWGNLCKWGNCGVFVGKSCRNGLLSKGNCGQLVVRYH